MPKHDRPTVLPVVVLLGLVLAACAPERVGSGQWAVGSSPGRATVPTAVAADRPVAPTTLPAASAAPGTAVGGSDAVAVPPASAPARTATSEGVAGAGTVRPTDPSDLAAFDP